MPWNAATPLPAGEEHPELIDQDLVDALNHSVLEPLLSEKKRAHAASLAFLYMYMKLSKPDGRSVVHLSFFIIWPASIR